MGREAAVSVVLAGGYSLVLSWDRGWSAWDTTMTHGHGLAQHYRPQRTLGPCAQSSGIPAP